MQTNCNDSRFNIIAQSYENAMANYPNARKDGDWLINALDVQKSDIILEISAGTGFLTKKIAPLNIEGILYAQDTAPRTLDLNKEKCVHYNHIQYLTDLNMVVDNSCDKSVTLGGWHHMEDQITVIRTAMRKLKEGGIFCVGDFSDQSGIQRYFDEVVDKITNTGHQALFASKSRMLNLGRFSSVNETIIKEFDVPFEFNNSNEIGDFFQKVFALNQTSEKTYNDINEYFAIENMKNGKLAVMISYIYAKYTK